MKDWNEIFRKKGALHKKTSPNLIRVIPLFKKYRVKKILDIGCGMGRHLKYLKEKGFDVYGCDISAEALKASSKIINKSKLKKADMSKLPYKNNSFDSIISIA